MIEVQSTNDLVFLSGILVELLVFMMEGYMQSSCQYKFNKIFLSLALNFALAVFLSFQ